MVGCRLHRDPVRFSFREFDFGLAQSTTSVDSREQKSHCRVSEHGEGHYLQRLKIFNVLLENFFPLIVGQIFYWGERRSVGGGR